MKVFRQQEHTRRHTSLVVSRLKFLICDQITELRKHVIMAYVILERMEKEEIDGMLFSVFICLFILLFGGGGVLFLLVVSVF